MKALLLHMPFLFGLVAACIHVLTGPDHLAAVGPLAVNAKKKPWLIGMTWGIGHVLGMMIIGILFFFFREMIPVELISANGEKIVGIMLLLIGFWALFRLYRQMYPVPHKHLHLHQNEQGEAFLHTHSHSHHHFFDKHQHPDFQRQSLRAALGIGIIHGLAGVSHLIGLLPTLAYTTAWGSALYLVGFAVGTLIAMSLFSMLMGLLGKYTSKTKKELTFRLINGIVGFSAIFVGTVWIWQAW
jgi:ABC-type nickel/cobalt efflux system permease component RcnA